MKKKWIIPAALLLIGGLMLAGCPGNDDPEDKGPAGTTWTVRAGDGTLHKQDTTYLVFEFSETIPRGGITADDITIEDGTGEFAGSATKSTMSDSPGPTRSLSITVEQEGNIKVTITKAGFSPRSHIVDVHSELGYMEDPTVNIADIVLFGEPVEGENVTFARFRGDPVAVLAPVTYESINTLNNSLDQELVTFDPPLDLTTTGELDFRWFDMVWEGLGSTWEYADDEILALHHVTFQLVLTTSTNSTITFQKQAELDTTNAGLKVPLQFLKGDITAGTWGTGHSIKSIAVKITGQGQLRDLENGRWPNIDATHPVTLADLWIVSLDIDTMPPSTPLVLYTQADGWNEDIISNPCWGFGDAAFTAGGRNELFEDDGEDPPTVTLLPIPQLTGQNDQQKIIYFDPINLIDLADKAPYSTIVVTHTGGNLGYWNGQGIISVNPAWIDIADEGRVKLQMFGGSGGSPLRLVLNPNSYDGINNYWNPEMFMGFFIQWNSGNATITEIRVE